MKWQLLTDDLPLSPLRYQYSNSHLSQILLFIYVLSQFPPSCEA